MLNAYWEPLDFDLPGLPLGQQWHRLVDTALASPDDFLIGSPLALPTDSTPLPGPGTIDRNFGY